MIAIEKMTDAEFETLAFDLLRRLAGLKQVSPDQSGLVGSVSKLGGIDL